MPRLPYFNAFLALLSGVLVMVLWWIGLRWVAVLLLFWMSVLGIGLLKWFNVQFEKLLLYTLVLANSIRMDVRIGFSASSPGFAINLADFCWLALMILWGVRVRRTGIANEWPRRFLIPFLLLLLGGIISSLQNPQIAPAFRGAISVLQSLLTFFYLWNARLEDDDYHKLALGISIALGIQGIIGGLQGVTHSTLGLEFFGASNAAINTTSFTSFSRVGGTIGQPNRFAMFVNAVLFVPLAMLLEARSWKARIFHALCFLAAFGALIMSQSRGAWMGFFAGFVPFAYLSLRERMGRFFSGFSVAWILIGGLVSAVSLPPIYERLTAADQNSAYSRVPMCLTALQMIRHNPWGVGLGQYVNRMTAYDVTQDGLSYHFRFPVHNAYLLLCAEQGIWVLAVYLVLFGLYYREVFRLVGETPGFPRIIGLAFGAGMIAVHLHMNLEITYLMTDYHQWFAMGMVLCVLKHLQRRREAQRAAAPVAAAAPPVIRGRAPAAVPGAS